MEKLGVIARIPNSVRNLISEIDLIGLVFRYFFRIGSSVVGAGGVEVAILIERGGIAQGVEQVGNDKRNELVAGIIKDPRGI